MAVQSMTGFARSSGQYNSETSGDISWTVELRAVNGKGLDIRLRMPSSLDPLDKEIRTAITNRLTRGNVSLNITLKNQAGNGRIELNRTAFEDVLNAAKTASDISGMPMPGLDALLSMRQVLELQEQAEDEAEIKQINAAILADIKTAIESLATARLEEGSNLAVILDEKINEISGLVNAAIETAAKQAGEIETRLAENIKQLTGKSEEFDPQRLHQEAVMIAVKADISEELDRLKAHIEQARSLLAADEPIGRRFDFLCQEFNREANTLCAKSQLKELTYIGLELKTLIDQLREQVQNIE